MRKWYLFVVTGPWVSQSIEVNMLSSVICLFPNKEKSKLLDWKKGLVLRPILHSTFVSWSMLSDWFAISLASSWGTGNFACTLVKFLPISPVEPGYLLSIPSHSPSLHISRLQHIWSLLLSLLILLFPTPFPPEVSQHYFPQERLAGCSGKGYLIIGFQHPFTPLTWK